MNLYGRNHVALSPTYSRNCRLLTVSCISGLSRSGFFQHCAFQGDTFLRIFHTLQGFSEDLDFMLIKENTHFSIKQHLDQIT